MAEYIIDTADLKQRAPELHAGDRVILSGTVYTSRDAAHKRLVSIINEGGELPSRLTARVFIMRVRLPRPRAYR